MTRRYFDLSCNRERTTTGEAINAMIGMLIGIIIILFAIWALFTYANAHDSWINKGGFKNGAGEWCCGDYDCKSYTRTATTASGWMIDGELVPFDEAMPIAPPDGQLTICRRPDGTRRCVFGVRPSW